MTSERHPQGCCVLTLHRIVDEPDRPYDVGSSSYRSLLDALSAVVDGFSTDLLRPAPRTAVLTFDDGSADHLPVAEELAGRGTAAVFFVPSARLGRRGSLTADDARQLVGLGHVVGSHAHDHAPLAGLSRAELRRQVVESKLRLEDALGTAVSLFAPPGGVGHRDLRELLQQAGYDACRSMRWGFYRTADDRWDIPCLPVTEFTLRSGWIERAARNWALPPAMRVTSVLKRIVPARAASRVRGRFDAKA
jgi:peptidoglycan/xylan/chitin deacetylase (PgdA/CDA1 family)